MSWQLGLQYAALTDIGMRRKNNQDSHAVVLADNEASWRERGHLFVVADGMGAHAAGELASKLAADGIPHLYHKLRQVSPPEALQQAIIETNSEIHRRGRANIEFHNMGTTAVSLVVLPQGALIGHVGDSRAYRLRGNVLEQLTFDHSLVWELRAAGQVPADVDFARLVPKNVITRSLGPNEAVQVDIEGPYPLQAGDTFLLCSDGLTGLVTDEELGPILANLSPSDAARLFVDLANLRGGPDNITVIVVRVGPPIVAAPSEIEPLTLGVKRDPKPIHPAVWIVTGVCALAAAVMAISQNWIVAAIALAGSLIALGAGLIARMNSQGGGRTLPVGSVLGKGPHSRTDCSQLNELLGKLAEVARELREAATENSWKVDWTAFNHHLQQATQAVQSGQHSQSLSAYAKAITQMMDELRKGKTKRGDSSSIDL